MRKILPFAGGVCGVLSGSGMICGMIWELPQSVWLLIAAGYLVLTAALLYNFYTLNKRNRR